MADFMTGTKVLEIYLGLGKIRNSNMEKRRSLTAKREILCKIADFMQKKRDSLQIKRNVVQKSTRIHNF